MQWGLGLRDLHLGSREAELAGTVGEPAGKEGFAAAILATDRLENTPPRTDSSEFVLQRPFESFKAHRECVQAASWHGARLKESMISKRRWGLTDIAVSYTRSNCLSSRSRLSSIVSEASSRLRTG